MSEILFLAHRVPFPPDRGDKIRSHHILQRLAEIAPVHVATFGDTDDDMQHGDVLGRFAASHKLVRRSKPLWRAGLEALNTREPISLTAFRDEELAQWVRQTLTSRPISTIYVFSGQMGQYVPDHFAGRVLLDLVDVDSAKFEAYAKDRRWPVSWLYAREGALLAREETRLALSADHTLLVSAEEAALFRSRCPQACDVRPLANGIDTAFFDPSQVTPHDDLATGGPHIVFTGQMDYPPNIAAAARAVERLLPAIRSAHPDAQLHIVGRAPPPALTKFDGADGVRVWGAVPDVRPFIAGATIVMVPLEIARGVQNKVLEAMAMGRPVVATSGAATGIAAEPGKHLLVADDDHDLITGTLGLIADPARGELIGNAARCFVLEQMTWPAALADLPELAGFIKTGRAGRDAA